MPNPNTSPAIVKICPSCGGLHLRINSITSGGNDRWVCRKDRTIDGSVSEANPEGLKGCGYGETPDGRSYIKADSGVVKVPKTSAAERQRHCRARKKQGLLAENSLTH